MINELTFIGSMCILLASLFWITNAINSFTISNGYKKNVSNMPWLVIFIMYFQGILCFVVRSYL